MTIELPRELEELVRSRVGRGDYASPETLVWEAVERLLDQDEDEREELQQAVAEGLGDIGRGHYTEYDEHTIKDLAQDVHQRGIKRIADLQKTGASPTSSHS
jgi:Arc/MetJ-type ribon-helix-helix transcriptional regulator